jgi:hypothetical protein
MSRLREGWGVLAATALVVAVVAQGASAAPAPVADYQFHDNRSSSVPGAPGITDVGSGNTFVTEGVAGCSTRALAFPQHNGLSLDTSGLRTGFPISETIVIDFRLADVSGYRRLIQTADTTDDSGLYVRAGRLDWYDAGTGSHEGGPVIAPDTDVEVALIQSAILDRWGMFGFVNGVQQFNFTSDFEVGPQLRLFKDNQGGVEDSAGAVFRVRFWKTSLVPADIPAIYSASLLGNPSSCPGAEAKANRKPRAVVSAYGGVSVDTGITAACPDAGVICSVDISVTGGGAKKSKSSVLASGHVDLPAGISQSATIVLNKRGKKLLLKRGKAKITATVSATGPNGKPAIATSSGKVKQPHSKKRR